VALKILRGGHQGSQRERQKRQRGGLWHLAARQIRSKQIHEAKTHP
jgi:hypothetical protein